MIAFQWQTKIKKKKWKRNWILLGNKPKLYAHQCVPMMRSNKTTHPRIWSEGKPANRKQLCQGCQPSLNAALRKHFSRQKHCQVFQWLTLTVATRCHRPSQHLNQTPELVRLWRNTWMWTKQMEAADTAFSKYKKQLASSSSNHIFNKPLTVLWQRPRNANSQTRHAHQEHALQMAEVLLNSDLHLKQCCHQL